MKVLSSEPGHWSGGFPLEDVNSFTLHLRGADAGASMFLRAESLLKDATYFLVISDADSFPPPFRVDNFSEVCWFFLFFWGGVYLFNPFRSVFARLSPCND